jgi:arabinosyltransferase C
MNIHSYDVLLIALVMVAFLAMQLVRRSVDLGWIIRSVLIASGAALPALWFLHVLRSDPVFQARAATPTYSPNFKILFFGSIVLVALAAFVLLEARVRNDRKRIAGIALYGLLVATMFWSATTPGGDGYFMSLPVWITAFAVACASAALLAGESVYLNLVVAWAMVGLVAPYFPALYERKLTMGLSVPWAILAAIGIAAVARDRDRSKRNMITALSILVIGGSSLRWFFREVELAKLNVSNTTLHSVFLSRDVRAIIKYLNEQGHVAKRAVVIALPGVAQKEPDTIDSFLSPLVTDLNPVLSGLTGVYSYAGHWSETPDYIERRNDSTRLFLAQTPDELRREILTRSQADYIVAPDPNAFAGIANLESFGSVVAGGNQFRLIRLRKD